MADSTPTQVLAATFAFGLVVCAALGTVLVHSRRGASSLMHGGLRLVLVGFLIFIALWAIDGFIATFIDESSFAQCQVVVIVASVFDQLARISLEEYLFWEIQGDMRNTLAVIFSQIIIFLRFVLGGVFVGIQRPQFAPVCVATNLLWPIGVAVAIADTLIIIMLLARAASAGVLRDMAVAGDVGFRAKGLILITITMSLWIVLSVPMTLGVLYIGIAIRTALPAAGVMLIIACIIFFYKGLVRARQEIDQQTVSYVNQYPGYPNAGPPPPRGIGSQEVSAINSTHPILRFPRAERSTANNDRRRQMAGRQGTNNPNATGRPILGQGFRGVPVTGQLPPPIETDSAWRRQQDGRIQPPSKKIGIKGGRSAISYPIIHEDRLTDSSPLKRIATVDLAIAAMQDRQRRSNRAQGIEAGSSFSVANPVSITHPSYSTWRNVPREAERAGLAKQAARQPLEPIEECSSTGASSSVLSPPLVNESGIRQRSPKHISQLMRADLSTFAPTQVEIKAEETGPRSNDNLAPCPPRISSKTPIRPSHPNFVKNTTHGESHKSFSATPQQLASSPAVAADSQAAATTVSLPLPQTQREQRTQTILSNKVYTESRSRALPKAAIDALVPPSPPLFLGKTDFKTFDNAEGDLGMSYHDSTTAVGIPGGISIKNNIHPSKQRSRTPPPEYAKITNTTAQLRTCTDLQNTPVAQVQTAWGGNKQVQAIMSEDDTDYSSAGGRDHDGAAHRESMVNRPRPIPRRSFVDFHAGLEELVEPTRDRSKKFPKETFKSKTTILEAIAGRSSQLPPLPPIPKSFILSQTISNAAASKTKVNCLTREDKTLNMPDTQIQRSAIPHQPGSPPPRENQDSTRSNLPSQQDAQTGLPIPEARTPLYARRNEEYTGKFFEKFNITTTVSPMDNPLSAYLQSAGPTWISSSKEDLKRRSSPVLPLNDSQESATPISGRAHRYNVDSHSPGPVIRADKHREATADSVSRPVEFPPATDHISMRSSYAESTLSNMEDDSRETMTIMLDRTAECAVNVAETPPSHRVYGGIEGRCGSWHRRIGDNCPTFSDRHAGNPRRAAGPQSLELNTVSKRSEGPSLEPFILETPQHALDVVKQQLRKFNVPGANKDKELVKQRMTLLADIETEMGLQEGRWQEMRVDISGASYSTSATSVPSSDSSAGESPQEMRASPLSGTRANNSVWHSNYAKGQEQNTEPQLSSTHAADQVQASHINSLLTRLHSSAVNTASKTSETSTLKTLSDAEHSKPLVRSLGIADTVRKTRVKSRNTDLQIDEVEREGLNQQNMRYPSKSEETLQATASQQSLRSSASESVIESIDSQSPEPWLTTRGSSKGDSITDRTHSSHSQEKITSASMSGGVWNSAFQSPHSTEPSPIISKTTTRPVTLKPPRRSRRISTLPDILEEPVPLKNKRGTLGIYQFPWGEQSDTATLPPVPPLPTQFLMGMASDMAPGAASHFSTLALQMQMLQFQQQPQSQQSSYFDYQDDDEATEYASELSENDSCGDDDDSLDDTTLWDIVGLLRSDKVVASSESLLSSQASSRPLLVPAQSSEAYCEVQRDRDHEEKSVQEGNGLLEEQKSPRPFLDRTYSSPTLGPTEAPYSLNDAHGEPTKTIHGITKEDQSWPSSYVHPKSPLSGALAEQQSPMKKIGGTSMWTLPLGMTNKRSTSFLWSPGLKTVKSSESKGECVDDENNSATQAGGYTSQARLWSAAPPSSTSVRPVGLPEPEYDTRAQYKNLYQGVHVSSDKEGDGVEVALDTNIITVGFDQAAAAAGNSVATQGADARDSEREIIPSAADTSSELDSPSTNSELLIDLDSPEIWAPLAATAPATMGNKKESFDLFQFQFPFQTSTQTALENSHPTPRPARRSPPSLKSHNTWTKPTQPSFPHAWVTALSSKRPSTPPHDQEVSSASGSESVSSDTSSTYSNDTGESTVGSFLTGTAVQANVKPRLVTTEDWKAALIETSPPRSRERNDAKHAFPDWTAALRSTLATAEPEPFIPQAQAQVAGKAQHETPPPSSTRASRPKQALSSFSRPTATTLHQDNANPLYKDINTY